MMQGKSLPSNKALAGYSQKSNHIQCIYPHSYLSGIAISIYVSIFLPLTSKHILTYTIRMKRKEEAQQSDVFHAISDPTRRGLLDLIARGSQPVKVLAQEFAMTRPAVSQHLRVLAEAGLIVEKKVGREHHYQLQAEPLSYVHDWVQQYERFWQGRLELLGKHLDTME
jgi:DNA-binding transcriptional ArsR family regulator